MLNGARGGAGVEEDVLIVVCSYFCVAGSGDGTPEQWGPKELTDWAAARVSVAHAHMQDCTFHVLAGLAK